MSDRSPDIEIEIFVVGGPGVGKSSLVKFVAASGHPSKLAALQPALLPFSEYQPSSGFEKYSLASGKLGNSNVNVIVTDIAAVELLVPPQDALGGKQIRGSHDREFMASLSKADLRLQAGTAIFQIVPVSHCKRGAWTKGWQRASFTCATQTV